MDENIAFEGNWRQESLPQDEAEVRARHEANRQGWNEGAQVYASNLEQSIAFLRAGGSKLHPIERRNLERLGKLNEWCKLAIHLQCASGEDTLSLWNEGVQRVVGVDISDLHIENARKASAALNAPAEWFRCDVLETPHELDGTADLVYTGQGALCWLQDLNAWGKVIYRLLKPGAVLHILDDHPANWLFNPDAEVLEYSGSTYFDYADSSVGWPSTYIGDKIGVPPEQQARKYERLWTLADIFNALRGAGLTIEYLGEHPDPFWDSHPNLRPDQRGRIPLTFSLLAKRNE
jgi:SAM-dependent methyltransferase